MKKEKKRGIGNRKIALIIFSVMLCSVLPFLNSQEMYSAVITAGETLDGDMTLPSDSEPSSLLGAVISQVGFYFERFIDFDGTKIWSESETTIYDFELLAFPEGSPFVDQEISYGSLFESTELISVRETSLNIWDTTHASFLIESGIVGSGDEQTIRTAGDSSFVLYADDFALELVSFDGDVGDFYTGTSGVPTDTAYGILTYVCGDVALPSTLICPSELNIETAFIVDVDYSTIRVMNHLSHSAIIIRDSGNTTWYYFGDIDVDEMFGIFIQTEGYSVDSFEGQSVAVLPSGSYDLYGELII